MSEVVAELYASRGFEEGQKSLTAKFMFMVYRTEEELLVRKLLIENSPNVYLGMVRDKMTWKTVGGGVWNCEIDYKPVPQGPKQGNKTSPGDPVWPSVTIDFSAQTRHVTQSLNTLSKTAKMGDARPIPDYKNAIGVSRTSDKTISVAGCDIPVPHLTWTETWAFSAVYFTWQYVRQTCKLIGRVNQYSFRGFPAGEVMFLGGHAEPRGIGAVLPLSNAGIDFSEDGVGTLAGAFNVSFVFAQSPNVTDYVPAPGFPGITKTGWQYLWADYEDVPAAGNLLVQPRVFYVEEVGPDTDDSTDDHDNIRDFGDPTTG